MVTKIIMLLILAFLAICLLGKTKYQKDGNKGFFDITNTKAMRGFWSIIVILVHIPTAYHNSVQTLLGSFANIGVTFFFMTSAFGLTLQYDKNPERIKNFLWKRIPKVYLPKLFVNLISAAVYLVVLSDYALNWGVLYPKGWVMWMLVCYLIFWVSYLIFKNEVVKKICLTVMVIAFSVFMYVRMINGKDPLNWSTEIYGFIYGMLLATYYKEIYNFLNKKWFIKTAALGVASLVFGAAYVIKLKQVVFYGDYLFKILFALTLTVFILAINTKFTLGNKLSLFLGEISYELFLVHPVVIKALVNIPATAALDSGLFIVAVMGITLVVATALHYIMKPLFKLMYGQKSK